MQTTIPASDLCILGIESSCDETSVAVSRGGSIAANIIATQSVHEQYGGVVPELASRAHMQHMVPVMDAAIRKAFPGVSDIATCLQQINAIAVTQSPGLIGSLLVGMQFAKSLALSLDIPLIAVHHMQAHVLANLIEAPAPDFPFLCLTVSGGHTQIVLAHSPMHSEVIGETLDDAAGEAFDKTAKLLGLPYPGGPLIDRYAAGGNGDRFSFAEPQIPGLNYSFSGLKTSVLYFLQKQSPGFVQENIPDLCASIQQTIVRILLKKLKKAAAQTGITRVCLAGGVSANAGLRTAFTEMGRQQGWQTFIPGFEYCTDNAAMIAITGHYHYLAGNFADLAISPSARETE